MMRIILLESSNTGKTGQSPLKLISMQHAKICESNWQLPERSQGLRKHETMTWTIHGLETETVILYLHDKQVFLVFRVMTGSLP